MVSRVDSRDIGSEWLANPRIDYESTKKPPCELRKTAMPPGTNPEYSSMILQTCRLEHVSIVMT
jgi:hypothetical protein